MVAADPRRSPATRRTRKVIWAGVRPASRRQPQHAVCPPGTCSTRSIPCRGSSSWAPVPWPEVRRPCQQRNAVFADAHRDARTRGAGCVGSRSRSWMVPPSPPLHSSLGREPGLDVTGFNQRRADCPGAMAMCWAASRSTGAIVLRRRQVAERRNVQVSLLGIVVTAMEITRSSAGLPELATISSRRSRVGSLDRYTTATVVR